jgi:DNA-directed RNA polymerase specialized sigma24 family protein
MMTDDEKSLINSLATGDRQAFEEIYRLYSKGIYRAANRFLQSSELAKEVVEEAFSGVWINRGNFVDIEQVKRSIISTARDSTYERFKQLGSNRKASTQATDSTTQ